MTTTEPPRPSGLREALVQYLLDEGLLEVGETAYNDRVGAHLVDLAATPPATGSQPTPELRAALDPTAKQQERFKWRANERADRMQGAIEQAIEIIEHVDNRAMAADGPVTPTREEMTDHEFRRLYKVLRAALEGSSSQNAATTSRQPANEMSMTYTQSQDASPDAEST